MGKPDHLWECPYQSIITLAELDLTSVGNIADHPSWVPSAISTPDIACNNDKDMRFPA